MAGTLQVGEQHSLNGTIPGTVLGAIDGYEDGYLWGWASDGTEQSLTLRLRCNGAHCVDIEANLPREDVVAAGRAKVNAGFRIFLPSFILDSLPSVIDVEEARTGFRIGSLPVQIQPEQSRPMVELASLGDLVVKITDDLLEPEQLMRNVPVLMNWLQRTIDRAGALRDRQAVQYSVFCEAVDAAGGLQGSVGHLFGLIQQAYAPIYFEVHTNPRVSIVVPVHNKFQLTYDCLASIQSSRTEVSYEIIVVDDSSRDETVLSSLVFQGGARLVRTPTNKGFVGACNLGWQSAKGEFILFLNNDTLVNDGWLDELVQTFDRQPEVGIVGSRLLFADGLLQEAGGIIWRDASGWNWGRGQDKMHPMYSFMRDADYVSGAALMIKHSLLAELSGFDDYYAPAYYEDTDLCFRVRQAGHRVVVQPASTIIHLEGQSNGTSTSSGLKRYQVVNLKKFKARWATVLAKHRHNGEEPQREAERVVEKRALFIDETTPTPDQDAGSNAAFEHMRSLQRLGYKVVFLPSDNMAHIPHYTEYLQAHGIECWYAPFAWSVEEYLRKNRDPFELIYLHRKANADRYLKILKKFNPGAHFIFNYADIHALRELREADLRDASDDEMRQLEAEFESELDIAKSVDSVIVHSTFEHDLIRERRPNANVFYVPWSQRTGTQLLTTEGRRGLAFIGGYGHPPNADAVDWFLADIWPGLRQADRAAEFNIVGSKMPERFKTIALPGVRPVGFVADLDRFLDELLVTVAPLRYGAGLKGKVLSSLARGVPCVMSTVAAEGMSLPTDLKALVTDDPRIFAGLVAELLQDKALWIRLAGQSRDYISQHFSSDEIDRLLNLTLPPGQQRATNPRQKTPAGF